VRGIWAAAFLLRRLRADVGVALLVLLLVGATAFLFAAAPKLLNRAADEGLVHDLSSARTVDRNIQISLVAEGLAGARSLEEMGTQQANFLERLPESIRSLISGASISTESIRFAVTDAPHLTYNTTFIRFRYQDQLDDEIELVSGRMPVSRGEPLPGPQFGFIPEDYQPPEILPRYEIALADRVADSSGIGVGDVLTVDADGNDARLPRAFAIPLPAEIEVVGIYHVRDPEAEIWYEDRSLQVMDLGGNDDNPIAFVTGLMAPQTFNDLAVSGLPFAQDWRFFVDPSGVDSTDVEPLISDLQRVQAQFVTSSTTGAVRQAPVFRSNLVALLQAYQAQRSASEAALSVAAIGPLVLAGAAVGMLGILIVNRRRAAIALTRGRGGSSAVVIGAQLWEAILLVGLAVLAGIGAAVWLVPGRDSPASVPLALAVGVGAVAALVIATWPAARRPLRDLHADEVPVLRPSPRRLVLEATAVLLAVGGIVLLQQRGLTVEEGQTTTFDPLLAATPALAGLAVGIVAMRFYPVPIRMLGWVAARRRDLVPVLGLRSVGRHPSVANLPLLVLMLTAAFGAFASVVTSTVDTGQQVASWENLGADFRIERIGGGPVNRLDPMKVPGIEAVAGAYLDSQAPFASTPNQRGSIIFYAIEPEAYEEVTAGSPIDPAFPRAFTNPDGPTPLGTPEAPIPAILSRRLPAASVAVRPGNTFTVEVAGQVMTFEDVQERLDFVALPAESAFVIAPLEMVKHAYVNQTLEANQLLVRGPASSEPALAQLVHDELALGELASRHAAYDALRQAPLVAAVAVGFAGALAVAAIYTALTVMAALTLSAAARTRDLAFLRTLGLSARQALQLTVVEHGPPVLIALIPGVLLGVGVAILLTPSLGLSAFAGSDRELGLTIDWLPILIMSAGLLLVVALAIGLSTWFSRRASAADALRIGDD
jgi:putative ABC transport system permease protein